MVRELCVDGDEIKSIVVVEVDVEVVFQLLFFFFFNVEPVSRLVEGWRPRIFLIGGGSMSVEVEVENFFLLCWVQ